MPVVNRHLEGGDGEQLIIFVLVVKHIGSLLSAVNRIAA